MSTELHAFLQKVAETNAVAVDALRVWQETGVKPHIVVQNRTTGDVIDEDDDEFVTLFELDFDVHSVMPASALRDAAEVEPLASPAILRDPAAKAAHAAEVRAMLVYLVGLYRAEALDHPERDHIIDEMVAALHRPAALKALSDEETVYDRWDMILEITLDALLEEFA